MSASGTANRSRLLILLAFLGILFALLLGRLFYVQVIWGPELQEKALLQWTKDSSLSAQRGRIMDRDGQVLAQSGAAYQVQVNPQKITAGSELRVATELATVLGMDFDYVLQRISDREKQQIILKRQVEREQVEQLMALSPVLGKSVTFGVDTKRYYPMGGMLAQTLGFTNVDGAGQEGLERSYNSYLSGESGRLIAETDRQNQPLAYGSQEYIPPVNGNELVLAVDIVVQSMLERAMERAMQDTSAAGVQGVVMQVGSGDILAVSVKPDFDPNAPPRDSLEELLSLIKMRVACDAYEPNGAFGMITLSAALDSGTVRRADSFTCKGYVDVSGEKIRCTGTHGENSLEKVVCEGCWAAYMNMALSMGADTLYDYIYRYGFGASTGSGLVGETSGVVIHQKYIRPESLARVAFGREISVTPIQLAAAASAVVNGGSLMQPTLVKQVLAEDGGVLKKNDPVFVRSVISRDTSATVCALLEAAVQQDSTKAAQIPGYRVGGIGGTARKYEGGKAKEGSLLSTYIGFAPVENPQYLVLILIDEPQMGNDMAASAAVPYVREVLQEVLLHYSVKPSGEAARVQVPNVAGGSAKEAAQALEAVGLFARYAEGEGDAQVRAQSPAAGSYVAKGAKVALYTAETGKDPVSTQEKAVLVTVPDVLKKTRLQVYDVLSAAGLELRIEPKDQSGVAVRQKPEAGTEVPAGEQILVDFSPVSGTG